MEDCLALFLAVVEYWGRQQGLLLIQNRKSFALSVFPISNTLLYCSNCSVQSYWSGGMTVLEQHHGRC